MFLKNNSNNDVLQNLDQIEKYLNNEISYIKITPSKKSSQISQKIANICEIINKKNDASNKSIFITASLTVSLSIVFIFSAIIVGA